MQNPVHDRYARIASLTGAEAEPLVTLFEAIACTEGWQPGGQLRAHRESSVYFGVSVAGELAGGMQVLRADAAGRFPFHAVWPEVVLEAPCRTAHVCVLAIRPERRGHLRLFWPLLIELWRFCVARDIAAIVIEATPPMLARYRRLGFDLAVIGALRPHWGEDCYLCRADATMVAGAVLTRAVRSPAFRSLAIRAMRPLADASRADNVDCAEAAAVPS